MDKNQQMKVYKMKEFKKILVVLYDKFNGSNVLITAELLERKEKMDEKTVQDYIIEHNLKISDYKAFWEKKFPKRYANELEPVMIIHNRDIKSVNGYLNYKLESKNKFNGMLVKDLIKEFSLEKNISLHALNEILKNNEITPIE